MSDIHVGQATYKIPFRRPLEVVMEADCQAGQALDPCSEMQAAMAVGDADNKERSTVLVLASECPRLLRAGCPLIVISSSPPLWCPVGLSADASLVMSQQFPGCGVTFAKLSWLSWDAIMAHSLEVCGASESERRTLFDVGVRSITGLICCSIE